MTPRQVVAVASGKGGVGKSTISANVAAALAADGLKVGLLDADLHGPDIPLLFGVTRTEEASSVTLWSDNRRRPRLQPYERHGVKLMSAQLLIGERQALAWQSNLVNLLLHRFFHGVDWGELDLLIVDLPPGTADAQQLVVGLGPTGTVVVVTPQDVAHLDAKKVLTMLREANVPVLGAVENMAWFACPGCGERNELFPPAAAERSIWVDPGVPRLATLPFTPSVSSAGGPIVVTAPESEEAQAFVALARRLSGTRA